jgi:TonB-dependent receptor
MSFRDIARLFAVSGFIAVATVTPIMAEQSKAAASADQKVRVTGQVRDETNAIPLPGVPIEVVGGGTEVVYTDVDGRYSIDLPLGTHRIRIALEGYQERTVTVDTSTGGRSVTADVGLSMAKFAETVTVTADAPLDAVTSSREMQLVERKSAAVITDNLGGEEMKDNGDSDAAVAMQRVTGLSVVDNQYVFVRGLGERYSNTTLAGSTLPTTEPDKKVVPLDMFPASLLDSVQVSKSYAPDRSAEFAGGLVQILPLKFPGRAVLDMSYGMNFYTTATGDSIPLSPLGSRDWLGYDNGGRAIPGSFPETKIVRQGVYTPEIGFTPEQLTSFGRALDNSWQPQLADGAPGQNWSIVFGNRYDKVGIVASATHSYKEQFVTEDRAFYRVAGEDELEAVSQYNIDYGTQKAQLGIVGNVAYQFTPNQRLSLQNFYSHSGRDEGRFFEGPNTENNFYYRNNRLQFIEEGLISSTVNGEHFFQNLSNSRVDWRVNYAKAKRDEPDLRETLYQSSMARDASGVFQPTGTFLLADESQSGFRMFNELDDETVDAAANWSVFSTAGSRPTQLKFGVNYIDRTRSFSSRRFRFIPISANKDAAVPINLSQAPEVLFASENVGTVFRFNEETRPVDAYDGDLSTYAGYGMVDIALSAKSRLISGARLERFEQTVTSFDPFGLFLTTTTSENNNTDVFPAVNFVQALNARTNLRFSYSTTVNRPEFRELATFEFTDVVGQRAVRGNPDLERALIQNVDARWEMFPGGRSIVAASAFYKYFDQPIERVVIAGAQPITSFRNAESARDVGLELEAGHTVFPGLFVSANYTYVDSKVTLSEEQRTVQTSLERPLAGQSNNLFNLTADYTHRGLSVRLLVNYYGDRISDVGSNQAPDVIEHGRPTVDLVLGQQIGALNIRVSFDNLNDSQYRYTQGTGSQEEIQRAYRLGRTIGFSVGFDVF